MVAYVTPMPESATTGDSPIGGLTRYEVMTAREVADLLRMPTSTVYETGAEGSAAGEPARDLRLGRLQRYGLQPLRVLKPHDLRLIQ